MIALPAAPHAQAPCGQYATAEGGPLQEVEGVLLGFMREARAAMCSIDEAAVAISDAIDGLIRSGGKRVRPQFVFWGHQAAGAPRDPVVATVAAAVEMLHTFALIHDDVMDRSARRRGQPTANAAFASRRARAGAAHEASWFGNAAAILAGDLAFVWAQQLFDSALPPRGTHRARAIFRQMQLEVTAGQYLDLDMAAPLESASARGARQVERARRVALLKSGRYTVTRPLQLGAVIAGAHQGLLDVLAGYGDHVGRAFQLRDDVLGLMGEDAVTGKCALDDLREGKRTLLVLYAFERATRRERSVLLRALGDPAATTADLSSVRDIVVRTGALGAVEAEIDDLLSTATAAISVLEPATRQGLLDLARAVTDRRC